MLKAFSFSIPIVIFAVFTGCTSLPEQSGKWWTDADQQLVISELNRTTEEVRKEIETLTEEQWNFREAPDRWNIAEIIEHLEMQNQLHFRELAVTSNGPQYLELRSITEGQDGYFTKYATDTIKGQANWFLVPKGKFSSKSACESAFYKARKELTAFVESTDVDLRKQFTYRAPVEGVAISELKIGEVRDLHQLLLTGIAHTDRHLRQIRTIKENATFPTP